MTGTLLREVEQWLLRSAEATSTLSRALLSSERTKLEGKLEKLEEQLNALYETELAQLRQIDAGSKLASPNELPEVDPVLRFHFLSDPFARADDGETFPPATVDVSLRKTRAHPLC